MAPVEPDYYNSNVLPIAIYAGQLFTAGILLFSILRTLGRAQQNLPPSQDTRARQSKRWRDVRVFATLAFASFLIASYHALSRRLSSYQIWADQEGEHVPSSFWSGWLTDHDPEGKNLQLGRWFSDMEHAKQYDRIFAEDSRGMWWTQAYFMGLISWSIFLGIEGRQRGISKQMLIALVLLSRLIGLGFAQNVFYIMMLLTPVAIARRHTSHGTWVPHLATYIVSAIVCLFGVTLLPSLTDSIGFPYLLELGYTGIPLFFSVLVQSLPLGLGRTYTDTHAARRSYRMIFRTLAVLSIVLHGKQTYTALAESTPNRRYWRHNFIWNMHMDEKRSAIDRTRTAVSRLLAALGENPAVSAFGWDVLLSAISLCAWTFIRGLDAGDILKYSIAPWIRPSSTAPESKHVTSNSIKDVEPDSEKLHASRPVSSTKRTRGRPKKSPAAPEASSAASQPVRSSRRRTTARHESESEEEYVPPPTTRAQVARIMHDEEHRDEDVVEDAEAGVLSWGLFVLGGLGLTSAGVLGAEACGS